MKDAAVVILAAGEGKRMKSDVAKVLHKVGGWPLVRYPLELVEQLKIDRRVLIVGHGREQVRAAVEQMPVGRDVSFVVQEEQNGTGHAVKIALPALRGVKGPVLILSGDVPFVERSSIRRLFKAYDKGDTPIAFLSFTPPDPSGYGRVLKDGRRVVGIREDRDCSNEERQIREVNAGIYLIDIAFLRKAVKQLRSDNDQGELYLTDLVEMAASKHSVPVLNVPAETVSGVNDRIDLARMEAVLRVRKTVELMEAGVTIRQPGSVQIDVDVKVGRDTELSAGVQLAGATVIGKGCRIEAGAILTDTVVEDGALIKPYSVLESAHVGPAAEVGPMGRLRPGARLGRGAKVGNFVEVKNTLLGKGSKANHLAYLGDGEIGEGVNVGAGTIFCNYDGFMKHKTVLEDGVFIGSDSQLIAPVTVGKGAYVASGSTVTKDVPPEALAIARAQQVNKPGLARKLKKTLSARKKKMKAEASGKKGPKK